MSPFQLSRSLFSVEISRFRGVRNAWLGGKPKSPITIWRCSMPTKNRVAALVDAPLCITSGDNYSSTMPAGGTN